MPVLADVENTADAWSARALTAATPWEAAGWSKGGQASRFAAILAATAPRADERLLDFGCGTGELTAHLPAVVEYIGFDAAAGMVERAQREHPGRRFQTWEPLGVFDITVAIGPFNLPGGSSKQHTWAALRRLWDNTTRVLACSLYAGPDDRCLIYTEDEASKFARGEAYRWRVERHLPNDLLMVLER
jgi:SAM-dependent methyltransferase